MMNPQTKTTYPYPTLRIFRKHAAEQRLKTVGGVLNCMQKSSSAKEFLESLTNISAHHIKLIEIRTRNQSRNDAWFVYRRHVITASTVYSIFHAERKGSTKFRPIALIASQTHIPTSIPAMLYGSLNEDVALRQYQKTRQMVDPLHRVKRYGLVLDPDFPAWGGSPDGIGITGGGERYLIEIKCPFSFAEGCLRKDGVDRLCYLEPGPTLRKTHSYYFQVQCLMGILRLDKCMLVVWCPQDMLVIPVHADSDFYNHVRETCLSYYKNTYLKHIFR